MIEGFLLGNYEGTRGDYESGLRGARQAVGRCYARVHGGIRLRVKVPPPSPDAVRGTRGSLRAPLRLNGSSGHARPLRSERVWDRPPKNRGTGAKKVAGL